MELQSPELDLSPRPSLVLPGEIRRREDMAAAKVARARRMAALYSPDIHPDDRAANLAADRYLCATDKVYFIDSWGWVRAEKEDQDPDLIDVPFILWPLQVDLLRWLDRRVELGQTALVPKSRELGVTWAFLWDRLQAWLFRGFSTRLVSRKEELVDKRHDIQSLFEKLRYAIGRLPPHLWPSWPPRFVDQHMILKNLHNRAELSGESTNAGANRGGRVQVIVFDEFAQVEPKLAGQTWRASESAARSRWVVYNPNGKAHKTYELYEKLSKDQIFEMRWPADPYRDEAWKASKIFPQGAMTDEEFGVEYDCSHEEVAGFKIWNFNKPAVVYNDSTPGWDPVMARRVLDAPGGWDFGSGFSLLVCLMGLVEWTDNPRNFRIRVDDERVWQQEAWYEAAEKVKAALRQYGGHKVHYGDPAAIGKESDQTSWINKLQGGGVPVWPLPAAADNDQAKMWRRKHVQLLLRQGRLFVHERCEVLLEAMANWRLDVPEGVTDLSFLNVRFVKPRKDVFSHPCEALMYLVDGVMMESRRRVARARNAPQVEPLSGSGSVATWVGMYRGAVLGEDD